MSFVYGKSDAYNSEKILNKMSINKEIRILLFSILLLSKRKNSIFLFLILCLLVFTISSASFITESIKKELFITHDDLPDIVIQQITGGRQQYIPVDYTDQIIDIPGIKHIYPRVWGYYYFDYAEVNFSIVGIDPFEPQYKASLEEGIKNFDIASLSSKDNWMIQGYGISKLFQEIAYINEAYFKKPDGEYLKLTPVGTLNSKGSIFNSDIVLVSKPTARILLGMNDNEATDIAIEVYNKNEITTIASKIRDKLKIVRTITKNDVLNSYKNVFNYKSGFLSAYLVFSFLQ